MSDFDLLLRPRYLLTLAEGDSGLRRNWALAIQDGRIAALGPGAQFPQGCAREELALDDHLLLPGFINTHGHLPMTVYAGAMPAGLPFNRVLFEWMLPLEADFCPRPEFVYRATLAGAAELIRAGVTTTAEMYYHIDQMARAFEESGLRGVLGETVMDLAPAPSGLTPDEGLELIQRMAVHYRGRRTIEIAVAPHTYYTAGDELLIKSAALAREMSLPFLMHVNETPDEVKRFHAEAPFANFYASRPGVSESPVVWLDKLGILDLPRVLFAHCVYLAPEEIALLGRRRTGVSFNAVCNAQIGLDVAPVPALQAAGAPVAIGTDGPLTNDRLDLFSQLLPAMLLMRGKAGTPEILSEERAVRMATLEAARALGMADRIGSLEPGKEADVIGLNIARHPRGRQYLEAENPFAFLVKAAATEQLDLTVVAGRILYPGRLPAPGSAYQRDLDAVRAWRPETHQSAYDQAVNA